MSPNVANFLFELVNVLLLAAALTWALFKPVRAALDAEAQRHSAQVEEGDRLRSEAQALLDDARAAQAAARVEGDKLRGEARAAAEAEAARILDLARQAAQGERAALTDELSATRQAEVGARAGAVGEVAGRAVRRLLEAVDGPELDEALVRAACAGLRGMNGAVTGPVTVEVARPLTEGGRAQLTSALGRAYGVRVVPELGAGARITTEAGQVDATAASLAREAAQAVGAAALPPAGEAPHA